MTALSALRLPRLQHPRPIAVLVASIAIVVASQATALLRTAAPAAPGAPANPPVTITGPVTPADAPVANAPGTLGKIDHSIAAWTQNLAANDKDFLSAANLAGLYEARARLSGDVNDYARANDAAERSLRIEPRQVDVLALHARLAFATHDFARALSEASALDRTAPDQPAILAIMGDALLELGNVPAATDLYQRIQKATPGPGITARLARLSFLEGDPAGAVRQAEAADAAAVAAGVRGPSLSWYAYLAGSMQLSAGNPDAASTWFDKALGAWPQSFLALAGKARASAALGSAEAAIAGYRAAIAVAPQPDALTALGDLLALQGDAHGAQQQYDTVLAIAQLQGSNGLVFNRQLVLFDVNHGRDLAMALQLADKELVERRDVYGYDAEAWALLANGRAAEADAAMGKALTLGTRDAMLLYHAGAIAQAVGDEARARDLLGQALAIRGALDPLSASKAEATLSELDR
jgi:tetratricopeptide (TPR) repeat protein